MPNKTQEYLNLAQQTAKELTRYWENWTDYLTTASRLYKYNYADQLMIYAQRPDATACASFDLWNDRMNRYVRRGSKGIALLDQSSSVPRLHYVFDVSDTGVRRNSRDPEVWQLGPDLMQPVSEMLAREYGVQQENLGQQIADICGRLVDSYWDNNSGDILDIVDGSLLMGYDEAGQEFQFKSAAAISITYAVLERCGFEPEGHFDRDDFQAIFSFSTPAAVYALGTAVSECSRGLLRSIERTVKTTIRRRNVERSQYEYEQQERDLLESRRLSASEPDPAPAGESIGQVRATAPDLPDEASPGTVQLDAPVGNSASAPVGSGAERGEPDTADHAEAAGAESGSEQRAASDGVGAAHEQPERTGRGTGDERADLQLSFFDTHIPTEAKQIESIDQAESEKSPSAFSLSQADIENALRRGSNFENSKLRIWKIYQLQPDRNLRAKALAKEYAPNGPGGSSHTYLDLLCSLENLDEQGRLKSKAAMFPKRTIRPECTVTNVDTPTEALAVSIGERGRVDLPYMAELLGTPGDYERITSELSGVIFKDPGADPTDPEAGWRMADEYLSGNVRAKLRMAQLAAETNPEFAVNVTALEKAQPKDLEASEIDVRLGATWLAPEIIQKFMAETFQIPYYLRHAVKVRYSPYTAEWRIEGKSAMGRGDIISSETYGTSRANAYKILEDTLNLKDVRIYDAIEDEEGKLKRILNKTDTMLAQQKQQVIKDAFANWIWKDPQRRIALVKQYNELFNSSRPREYDGSHIHLVGMNPEITLREHQRNAIAHVLYGGNTLLAHEVGAGKTFEMAASAMEAKRLGLCQKSLFVVPNHLTEQWASEFLHLYPNAKLLVARKKDFETANRKKFCARIATGDYDAVIITDSVNG